MHSYRADKFIYSPQPNSQSKLNVAILYEIQVEEEPIKVNDYKKY